jgi:hypothetical protein
MRDWFIDEEMFELARKQLPANLDKQIDHRIWTQVDPGLKFILSLISARKVDCQWILIEASGLMLLGRKQAEFYLNLFLNRVLVMVFGDNLGQVGSFHEQLIAVMDNEHLAGLGAVEWFEPVRGQVECVLRKRKERKTGKSLAGLEDDDLG